MGKIAEVQEVTLTKLIPYVNNAKIHSEDQVTKIASSIREFGFLNPVFGVILSSIFLHEQSQTGLVTIISLILVCIGIFIVNYRKRTERK